MLEPEIKCLRKIDINDDALYGADGSEESDEKEGGEDGDGGHQYEHQKVLACLDDDCVKLLVYACETLFIKNYSLDLENDNFEDQV